MFKVDSNTLVRLFGFYATLLHGDPLVLDRWLFLRKRLPSTANRERLIDVGCGSGAFTIGAALRGYESVGLSWDERNQQTAAERAKICGAVHATFPIQDVRHLDKCTKFHKCFDIAVCFENIEHILDDRKLMRDVSSCLKPGGYLILTTPYYFYRSITKGDDGPFQSVEDGWHVRRGYTRSMLSELCAQAGLVVDEISFCSGFFSQKVCMLMRIMRPAFLGWVVTLPLRILPLLFDKLVARVTDWPCYSICLVAYRPRFLQPDHEQVALFTGSGRSQVPNFDTGG